MNRANIIYILPFVMSAFSSAALAQKSEKSIILRAQLLDEAKETARKNGLEVSDVEFAIDQQNYSQGVRDTIGDVIRNTTELVAANISRYRERALSGELLNLLNQREDLLEKHRKLSGIPQLTEEQGKEFADISQKLGPITHDVNCMINSLRIIRVRFRVISSLRPSLWFLQDPPHMMELFVNSPAYGKSKLEIKEILNNSPFDDIDKRSETLEIRLVKSLADGIIIDNTKRIIHDIEPLYDRLLNGALVNPPTDPFSNYNSTKHEHL